MSAPDITRHLSARRQGYVGGHLQQGRTLLDADDNEAGSSRQDDFSASIQDIAGLRGSVDDGFLPDLKPGQTIVSRLVKFGAFWQAFVLDYPLKPGSIQLAGRRARLSQSTSAVFQREFLQMGPATAPLAQLGKQHQLSVLRVWDQPVSAIEDTELLEPAMQGADGAMRLRRMARVETRTVEGESCADAFAEVLDTLGNGDSTRYDPDTGILHSNARLQLNFGSEPPGDCPGCDPLLQGRYLGQEDHSIRIMLASTDTYVWSYDNAAPLYRAKLIFDGNGIRLQMLTPPRDSFHEPELNRVVEILPWSTLLENGEPTTGKGFGQTVSNEKVAARTGAIGTVNAAYNASDHSFYAQFDPVTLQTLGLAEPQKNGKSGEDLATSTLKTGTVAEGDVLAMQWDNAHPQASELNPGSEPDQTGYVYVRFWHLKRPDETTGIALSAGLPLGRTGVVPVFSGKGQRGDYWHASLRVAAPDRVWPWGLMANGGLPPDGPVDAIAPIALVQWRSRFGESHEVISIQDCRTNLPAITNRGCCTHVVSLASSGRFRSVQEAIDALPVSGGRICIRAGTFDGAFQLAGRENVVIEGCGDRTILTDDSDNATVARIASTETGRIIVRNLTLRARGQIGVELHGRNVTLEHLIIDAEPGEQLPTQNAIRALEMTGLTIRNCRIRMGSGASPHAALYVHSSGDLLLERNRLTHTGEGFARAWGGIHLLGNSVGIEVRDNTIVAALGCGVTLGGVAWRATDGSELGHVGAGFGQQLPDGAASPTGRLDPQVVGDLLYYPEPDAPLVDTLITGNQIRNCTGAGIGVLAPQVNHDEIARAAPLCMRRTTFVLEGCITDNQLTGNGAGPGATDAATTRGGIILSELQNCKIVRNRIEGPARTIRSGPFSGLLVAYGADIWITANCITLRSTDQDPAGDLSGGIVLGLDHTTSAQERLVNDAPLRDVRIEENIVRVDHAPALLAYMGGECAVSANVLETRAQSLESRLPIFTANIIHPTRVGEAVDLPTGEPATARWVQPQGSAQFLAGRAQSIDATGQLMLSDNQITTHSGASAPRRVPALPVAIYSLGSVSFTDNQISAMAGPDQLIAHVLMVGATTLAAGNRVAESVDSTSISLISASAFLNLGIDNQLSHCPVIFGGNNDGADRYFAAEDNLTWFRLQQVRCEQLATDLQPDLAALLDELFSNRQPIMDPLRRTNSDFNSVFPRRES